MKLAKKYLKVILKHKWYVAIECFKRGLFWQGLIHDLSKLGITEFMRSARYFYGDDLDCQIDQDEYMLAWLHHKGHNKHHWEYWIDWRDGQAVPIKIPLRYLKEMLCDFIGASRAYNGDAYTRDKPLTYFLSNKNSMIMHDESKKFFHSMLLSYSSQ
jgi:hypothetical protein